MSDLLVDLSDNTALVTGAGAGCGRAIALALAASGANVAVADLNIERAETVSEAIKAAGGSAVALHVDVSNRFQAANMIERTRDVFGAIHVLVNAAGAFRAEPLLKVDEWDWRRQLEVNITGTFFCLQLVARVMADEGGGSIINLTSAKAHQGAISAGIGYITGKSSIIGMTRQAARELGPRGIRVNAIAAGNIKEDDMPQVLPAQSPLHRVGKPEDIAAAVLFLCSSAADFITGQVVVVDGGGSLLN